MKMNKSKAILLGVVAALGINQVYALDRLRVAEHAFTAQQSKRQIVRLLPRNFLISMEVSVPLQIPT